MAPNPAVKASILAPTPKMRKAAPRVTFAIANTDVNVVWPSTYRREPCQKAKATLKYPLETHTATKNEVIDERAMPFLDAAWTDSMYMSCMYGCMPGTWSF
ncbi:hypothetical protein MRB53_039966 [Persea americana]|nr:hypothetical protein MRB53_039966 [Persea americana]